MPDSVTLGQRLTIILLALGMSYVLNSCGTNEPPSVQSSSSATAAIECSGANLPCSASVEVPLILVDGSDPATYGMPIACAMTAGGEAMNFTTATSMPWFSASPASGSLQPGGSTTIGVPSVSANSVSGRNIGQVTVSASGYTSNSQMAVELNCNIAAGSCVVAYSCNPETNPLP
jgi:hypothetical protein